MEMIIKCLPQKAVVRIKWSNILINHLAQFLAPNVCSIIGKCHHDGTISEWERAEEDWAIKAEESGE